MSAGTRVPAGQAIEIAEELVAALAPACSRIEIAGSLRRGALEVGDVELVTIPRYHDAADGLWGTARVNELGVLVDAAILRGLLAPHPEDPKRGERYAKLLHRPTGVQVDLFSARPETFGLIYLIRTGPAAYSQALVTEARRRGFHVASGELHIGGLGCGSRPCEVVPTPEERDVYAALRLPVIEPRLRA